MAVVLILAVATSVIAAEIALRLSPTSKPALPDNTHGRLELLAGSTGNNFYIPRGLAFDTQGNLYVADSQHGGIRKISSSGEARTFFVGGDPIGLVVDSSGRLVV